MSNLPTAVQQIGEAENSSLGSEYCCLFGGGGELAQLFWCWNLLLQHSLRILSLASACTPAGTESSLPPWGSCSGCISMKTLPQVCGVLNTSSRLRVVSWETEQLAQPPGTWCGLDYK